MEDDILTQDEDMLDEEMKEEEEEQKKVVKNKPSKGKREEVEPKVAQETYEAFKVEQRFGIVNTITGESIEGFDPDTDEALVRALKIILNKLEKIAIASGAQ